MRKLVVAAAVDLVARTNVVVAAAVASMRRGSGRRLGLETSIPGSRVHTWNFEIEWGSEFKTSPDFEWLKRGWVANGPDFEWDQKSGSPTI